MFIDIKSTTWAWSARIHCIEEKMKITKDFAVIKTQEV